MKRRSIVSRGLLATVLVYGCATPEYRTPAAERDLRAVGMPAAQAHCVVQALRDHYAREYVSQQFDLAHHPDQVNPREVELYVRNKFAGQDRATRGEIAVARAIVAKCKR